MSVPVYIESVGDCDEIAACNETEPVTGLSKWVQPNQRNGPVVTGRASAACLRDGRWRDSPQGP